MFGPVAEGSEYGFIDGLFAEAADFPVGQPKQRIIEIDNLQNGLQHTDPEVVAFDMGQFVEEDGLELLRIQAIRQVAGKENHRSEQTAH